jgi:acetate kinase
VLDGSANAGNRESISAKESSVRVKIVPAEEEAQIARHTYRLLQAGGLHS